MLRITKNSGTSWTPHAPPMLWRRRSLSPFLVHAPPAAAHRARLSGLTFVVFLPDADAWVGVVGRTTSGPLWCTRWEGWCGALVPRAGVAKSAPRRGGKSRPVPVLPGEPVPRSVDSTLLVGSARRCRSSSRPPPSAQQGKRRQPLPGPRLGGHSSNRELSRDARPHPVRRRLDEDARVLSDGQRGRVPWRRFVTRREPPVAVTTAAPDTAKSAAIPRGVPS